MFKLSGYVGRDKFTANLPSGRYLIGRNEDCDIMIKDQTVSRQHARISILPDETCLYITDLKSSNGTKVNGRKIKHRTKVFPGDSITLGKIILAVTTTEAEELTEIDTDQTPASNSK
ncbi:MAG: FHA domain-containing protein [candidate division Zixibacteria bacterium]|nr:FHA domain-containing protein [candidate division Zixibacteria bacterium]